jgi:hypothetical protein
MEAEVQKEKGKNKEMSDEASKENVTPRPNLIIL